MKYTTKLFFYLCCLIFVTNNIQAQSTSMPPSLPGLPGFITEWETTTENEMITIPTFPEETYDYSVNWGDGTVTSHSNADASTNASHTYATAGIKTIYITGVFPRIYFDNSSINNSSKLKRIIQWGTNPWTSMERAFINCVNLDVTAIDTPNLDNVDSMYFMFLSCHKLSGTTSFNNWDVSNVSIFTGAFGFCRVFNQPLNNWNMSQATDTRDMFNGAHIFNQPLDNWDMSNVSYTTQMFRSAYDFNQDIGSWNFTRLGGAARMFAEASSFDQDLGAWNISKLRDADEMFSQSGMTTENYDTTLIGWSTDDSGQQGDGVDDHFVHPTNSNFTIKLGTSISYCTSGTARQHLIDQYNWAIIDEGLNPDCGKIVVSPKINLQGALLNPNTGEENLMRDDLRVAGIIPTTSPYTDMITCDASIFNTTDDDAIVDWVWVELRDENDKTSILASQSALLQRDGDIVRADGTSPSLAFNLSNGNYHITIKHRTHLGIMSANSIALRLTSTKVDFTDPTTLTFGTNPQTSFGMPDGTLAMWTGNVNNDAILQYSGTNPDAPEILSAVLNATGNFLNFPTFIISGYQKYDLNMDGNTQYSGTNPDTPIILQNVLAHPGNFLNFSTYQVMEQLPENN